MTSRRIAAGLFTLVTLAAAPSPAERVVTGDGVSPIAVDGAAGRVRIDPAGLGLPLLSPDYAARIGLRGGMIDINYMIGPRSIHGKTAVARVDLGRGADKHRVGWTELPYATGVDGVVGPGGVPEPIVRFELHPARPGERTIALPMAGGQGLGGGFGGLFATIDFAGKPLRLRFDPHHRRSLATAGAAVRIAAAQDGRMTGAAEPVEIAFGVTRPVRTMLLARPLQVGPFSFAAIGVRTGDFGSAAAIPDGPAQPIDPDEIVVTAKAKKQDGSHDRISIGSDQLDRCSSIVFDKPARQVRLTCS